MSLNPVLSPSTDTESDTLERLVATTNEVNLIALNECLSYAVSDKAYCYRAIKNARLGGIMSRAILQVGECIPYSQRAVKL